MNALNTNISGISGSKTIPLDTTNQKLIKKIRPTTGRINMNLKKNTKTLNYNNKYDSKSQKNLFSLIDIKDQFYSKAPNVPNQFKRKIYSKIDYYLYDKNSKQNLDKIPQIESYNYRDENNNKKIKQKQSSRKERLYKPVCWDNADIKDIKKEQKDKLMPLGYEYYEKIIYDNSKNYIKNNYVKIKEPKDYILLRKMNKLKNYKSNIFFLENEDNNKMDTYNKKITSQNRKDLYSKHVVL